VLWLMGMMGGGDVKLMAALGAWVGPKQMLWLVLGSMIVFLLLGIVGMIRKFFRKGARKTLFGMKHGAARDNLKKTATGMRRKDQLLAFSLPVAVATGLGVALFVWRDDPRVIEHRQHQAQAKPSHQESEQK
jgi:prepilin peptidase CpaA